MRRILHLTLALCPIIWPEAKAHATEPKLPPATHVDLVIERFVPLQHLSFATDFEYCGYLARDAEGALVFTEMLRGGHDGCTPEMPEADLTLIASMHTHGSYDPNVPAEFPTALDMESDRREGVNGYVATPGGRLWYIDSDAMVTLQLCPRGCLPHDPAFQPGDDGVVAQRYNHAELIALEAR